MVLKHFYFDSEHDNPRTKDPQMYSHPNGQSKGIGMINAIQSRWQSHGEVLEQFIIGPIDKGSNCVIFLDEPESGLSITNQFKLIKSIKSAIERGCQFFIATHCFPLIEEFNVISLEHNKLMSGKEFINLVK